MHAHTHTCRIDAVPATTQGVDCPVLNRSALRPFVHLYFLPSHSPLYLYSRSRIAASLSRVSLANTAFSGVYSLVSHDL